MVLSTVLNFARTQSQTDSNGLTDANGIVWANDTLIEAKKYFEGENYTALLNEIEKILQDVERIKNACIDFFNHFRSLLTSTLRVS